MQYYGHIVIRLCEYLPPMVIANAGLLPPAGLDMAWHNNLQDGCWPEVLAS